MTDAHDENSVNTDIIYGESGDENVNRHNGS